MAVPIADGHTHTNPVRGMGASRIAPLFKKSGGWFMALVTLSPWSYGIDFNGLESYKQAIDVLIRECMSIEEEGLKAACIAGIHPADVDKLIDKYKIPPVEVVELGVKVIDYVAELCREGVLDGIGEVGHQHYKTTVEKMLISHRILEYALEKAKDYECVVHMHLENAGEITVDLIDYTVTRLGIPVDAKKRLIFHHSKPNMIKYASGLGYSSTLPGIPRLLEHAVGRLEPVYIPESDHIDDPARPGAVVYPWDMATTIQKMHESGIVDEEYLYKINIDNIERVYGASYS